MTTGIYAIVCRQTGERYVGQSVNIRKRWVQHRSRLALGRASAQALQKAWDEHGPDGFDFVILEECHVDALDERERFHMGKGSELNAATHYVRPLDIERELGIDPNASMLDDPETEEAEGEPSADPAALRARLEDIIRLAHGIENLMEATDAEIDACGLLDDPLISQMWENASDSAFGVAGALLEIVRRMDQLE